MSLLEALILTSICVVLVALAFIGFLYWKCDRDIKALKSQSKEALNLPSQQ